MMLGPVMLDVEGESLTSAERERLTHPGVGGVILFSRNFSSSDQLRALVAEIHGLREPRLLVSVDHEGGRVQRFRREFTELPPAARLGVLYDESPARARQAAEAVAWLLAMELRSVGIDFSFAPVLDLRRGISEVIGDRAFHQAPEVVADLGVAFLRGMRRGGMAAVGKHFPGHGAVRENSHVALPVDRRPLVDIEIEDLLPFERLIRAGLPAIMPAHVIYSQVDPGPAGFSHFWLQRELREGLGFQGAIFSDDLSMEAAGVVGGITRRAQLAFAAGCDMVLVCNHPERAERLLKTLRHETDPASLVRLSRMHGHGEAPDLETLRKSRQWQTAHRWVERLDDSPNLELDV